jgi:uncharacterized protein HemY
MISLLKATELDPHNSMAFAALGYLHYQRKKLQDAINFLTESINLEANEEAYYWRAKCYHDLKLYLVDHTSRLTK